MQWGITENIKEGKILGEGFFWAGVGGSSENITASRGGHVKKNGKLAGGGGGHAILKWCFPNPTSPLYFEKMKGP